MGELLDQDRPITERPNADDRWDVHTGLLGGGGERGQPVRLDLRAASDLRYCSGSDNVSFEGNRNARVGMRPPGVQVDRIDVRADQGLEPSRERSYWTTSRHDCDVGKDVIEHAHDAGDEDGF